LNVSEYVVFDFDGTLVARDSFLDFSVRYCLRRPARLLFAAALLPVAACFRLRSLAAAASVLLWSMTLGVSGRRFHAELGRYAREVLPRLVNPAVFAELERHLGDGRSVVVATGTLPIFVRTLLRSRGMPRLPVAGTRLRRRFGGFVAETHCIGPTKLGELERRFGITAWTTVYTDSYADRALMRGASEVVLVAPSRSTLTRARLLVHASKLRVL
jgi:phosphatidylglycerophosphatase C